jgi:hypothetical protein
MNYLNQNNTKYWIGTGNNPNPNIPIGVVGRTFIDRQSVVTHIDWNDSLNSYVADNKDFHFTFSATEKNSCRYFSMLTIPLKNADDASIGVSVLYSTDRGAFDSDESTILAERLAKIISLAWSLA